MSRIWRQGAWTPLSPWICDMIQFSFLSNELVQSHIMPVWLPLLQALQQGWLQLLQKYNSKTKLSLSIQESEELAEMQKNFQQEDLNGIRTADTDAAFKETSDAAMFRIHILEKRLLRYCPDFVHALSCVYCHVGTTGGPSTIITHLITTLRLWMKASLLVWMSIN